MTERKIGSSAFSFCKRCVGPTSCLVWEIEPCKLGTILSIQVSSSWKTTTAAQIWLLNRRRETTRIWRNHLWYLRDLEWLRQWLWTWKESVPKLETGKPRLEQCYKPSTLISRKKRKKNYYLSLTLASLSSVEVYICALLQTERQNFFTLVSSCGRQKSVFTNPHENQNVQWHSSFKV